MISVLNNNNFNFKYLHLVYNENINFTATLYLNYYLFLLAKYINILNMLHRRTNENQKGNWTSEGK